MTEEKAKQSRFQMSNKLVGELSVVLNAHCTNSADGYAVYEEGWDDARVLALFSQGWPCMKLGHVVRQRVDLIGELAPAKPVEIVPNSLDDIRATFGALKKAWDEQPELDVEAFTHRVGKVEAALKAMGEAVEELRGRVNLVEHRETKRNAALEKMLAALVSVMNPTDHGAVIEAWKEFAEDLKKGAAA